MTRRTSLAVALLGVPLLLAVLASPAHALQAGDKAPDFTLPGPDNKPVKLSELTANKPVVLYTFIQAFTGP